jgi:hypothetical protein
MGCPESSARRFGCQSPNSSGGNHATSQNQLVSSGEIVYRKLHFCTM